MPNKPEEKASKSGQYEIINPRGEHAGKKEQSLKETLPLRIISN